jgi:hypothetical protein
MLHPAQRFGRSAPGARAAAPSAGERRQELARLVPLWPAELDDLSVPGRQRIIGTLERALRAERRRGRQGHWAYDLARHDALLAAWRREAAALEHLLRPAVRAAHEKKGRRPRGPHPR